MVECCVLYSHGIIEGFIISQGRRGYLAKDGNSVKTSLSLVGKICSSNLCPCLTQ